MKTRTIQTRFWEDDDVETTTLLGQHLWIYLLCNCYINMCGIFKLPDYIIIPQAKLSETQLAKAKAELESLGKVFFYRNWIYVVNAEKQNNYRKSPKNENAYLREIEKIPEAIKAYFTKRNSTIDSSINRGSDTDHKSTIINQTVATIKKSKKKAEIEIVNTKELDNVVACYNEVFSKDIQSTKGFETNYLIWSKVHSTEKIMQAIRNAKRDKFWSDKMTLSILFRQKNTSKESVDYIEELANKYSRPKIKPATKPIEEVVITPEQKEANDEARLLQVFTHNWIKNKYGKWNAKWRDKHQEEISRDFDITLNSQGKKMFDNLGVAR